MAFIKIDLLSPKGTDRGQILDENIRDLKTATAENFAQISGYPDNTALVVQSWATDGRPTSGLKAGLLGWNTTLNAWDKYNGTAWEQIGQSLATWTVSGRPTTKYTGLFGFNTDLAVIERWNGSAWIRVAGGRRGDIKAWYGNLSYLSTENPGWVLCDGGTRTHPEGGTYAPPDLRDRVILGAGYGYSLGQAGGESSHTLTWNEMPQHYHTIGGGSTNFLSGISDEGDYQPGNTGGFSPSGPYHATDNAGSGYSHNNMPPFYALYFLYKI